MIHRLKNSILVFALLVGISSTSLISAAEFRISTFEADVTPEIGHPTIASLCGPAKSILDPLWVKGIVLQGADQPIVIATIDWCEIRNKSYDLWRDRLAQAAGTTRERVMFSALHQHDAPLSDNEAQELISRYGYGNEIVDLDYQEECLQRVAKALKDSLSKTQVITHYGLGQAEVEGVACNRRVFDEQGRPHYGRGSFTANLKIRNQPVGEIDPWLKTISFWNQDKPVVAVSTYAVHPMSYYCKGEVSSDFVGMARQKRQVAQPDVFQIYCTGCSGDLTASKYNEGNWDSRVALAEKLNEGMARAWEETEKYPLESVRYRVLPVQLSPRTAPDFSVSAFEKVLADNQSSLRDRINAALGISWLNRVSREEPVDFPMLDLGKAKWLILPAESFIGYQLAAQKLAPDQFVMTAGFGECAPGYLPTQLGFDEHFDDHHSWCQVGKAAPEEMLNTLRELLSSQPEK